MVVGSRSRWRRYNERPEWNSKISHPAYLQVVATLARLRPEHGHHHHRNSLCSCFESNSGNRKNDSPDEARGKNDDDDNDDDGELLDGVNEDDVTTREKKGLRYVHASRDYMEYLPFYRIAMEKGVFVKIAASWYFDENGREAFTQCESKGEWWSSQGTIGSIIIVCYNKVKQ